MRQQAVIEMTGYLAKDGELRRTRDQRAVLGLTMAYTRSRRNPQTNQYEDVGETLWARFALWDDAATQYADRMRKGTPVKVKGIPELRTWEKDGRSGVNLEIQFAEVSIVAEVLQPRSASPAPQAQTSDAADAWSTPGAWGDDTPF
ncbi:single-stranded DNA-binding protein [Microbacterium hydrocarbonoxydans]|uniref:single-stranded DNA-binding protein n=1 Tax=Microbacterium hydrocarbonoxydans TaxID=273678 RepID=UPI003D96CA94